VSPPFPFTDNLSAGNPLLTKAYISSLFIFIHYWFPVCLL